MKPLSLFFFLILFLASPAAHGQDEEAAAPTVPPPGDTAAAQTDGPPPPNSTGERLGLEVTWGETLERLGPVFDPRYTPYWAWGWLAAAILLGLIVGKLVQLGLRSTSERLVARGWELRGVIFLDSAAPALLAIFTIGLHVGLIPIYVGTPEQHPELEPLRGFIFRTLQLLIVLSLGWFLYNLVDVVELGLRRLTRADTNRLAGQLVPLIRKALRIFVVVVFTLFIAQNIFEQNITAWLAGLGIAGLAVSLAGQESIKNLFGSITVLLDKPFVVGDRISFNSVDGFVEEIGFRSTKVRTFNGHLITIPNMKFIDGQVENITARPFIRRNMNVTITYDTAPERIEQAVQIIKDLLADEEFAAAFNLADRPPRVFFNDFNADSLNITVSYWYLLAPESAPGAGDGRDWWTYQQHAERFNMRLFRAFGEAGIDFAFPTQTLYLAGDPDRQLAVRLLPGEDGQEKG